MHNQQLEPASRLDFNGGRILRSYLIQHSKQEVELHYQAPKLLYLIERIGGLIAFAYFFIVLTLSKLAKPMRELALIKAYRLV